MKIFISYNHKDQTVALKIRDILLANEFEVLLDIEKMRTGQDIEQFILQCIKESGITLSLISSNSLMSAWVTMETMISNVNGKLRDRNFMPCYIDKEFFDRDFTGKALEKIENELKEITDLMKSALDKGWGIEDLQSERTRYNKMKANLPEIIGKLRNSLCIDLTPANFNNGMQKILDDLRKNNASIENTSIKTITSDAIGELQNRINTTLDESSKQRLANISQRLLKLRELLDRYEQEFDFESDPKRKMRYEREIESTKTSIQKTLEEIKSLS